LFYREEQSVRQVASLLGISESAVKKRLERARSSLRSGVEGRFAALAGKSAVTSMFVASVMGCLAFAAPSTAAAGTVLLPKAGKSVLLAALVPSAAVALRTMPPGRVALAAFLLPDLGRVALMSATLGVVAVLLLVRRLVKTAIDARERRELKRFAVV